MNKENNTMRFTLGCTLIVTGGVGFAIIYAGWALTFAIAGMPSSQSLLWFITDHIPALVCAAIFIIGIIICAHDVRLNQKLKKTDANILDQ